MDLYVRNWDEDLQRELRAEAIQQGLTVREVLEEAIRLWLSRQARKGRKKGGRRG